MPDDTACSRCGELRSLDQFYGERTSNWCKFCYREWHRGRYEPKGDATDDPRECQCCGVTYRPRQRRPSWFCSQKCIDLQRTAKRRAAKIANSQPRVCVWCGGSMPQSMRSDAAFCSERCNYVAHHVTGKMFRRVGQSGRGDEPLVQLAALGRRSNWRCGICGGRVDRNLRHPDPLAASVDHIVPLSRGGTNDTTNLQVAHFRCNWSKRATLPNVTQPRLF